MTLVIIRFYQEEALRVTSVGRSRGERLPPAVGSVFGQGGEEPNVLQLRSGCHSRSVDGVDVIRASQSEQIYLSLQSRLMKSNK